MKKRKQTPLVVLDRENELELRNVRLVKQVPFYPFRLNDELSIRNMGMRNSMETMHRLTDMYNIPIPYEIKIQMIQDWYNTSSKNIEKVTNNNPTDK